MLKKVMLAATAILTLGVFAFLWIAADPLSPRSDRTGYFAIKTVDEFDLSDLDEWNRAAKEKYGPAVQTPVRMINGGSQWEARLDNTTLEIRPLGRKLITTGVFAVDDPNSGVYGPNGDRILFPFVLRSGNVPLPAAAMSNLVKHDFEDTVPATVLAFAENGWQLDACHRPDATVSTAVIGAAFHPEQRDICLVERADGRGPMLIGSVTMTGSLIQPFGRRSCRDLSSTWLESMRKAEPEKAPAYVGCLLIAAIRGAGSPRVVTAEFFEVRRDQSLAVLRNSAW
jgi:hypothetical protein